MKKKKLKKKVSIGLLIMVLILVGGICYLLLNPQKEEKKDLLPKEPTILEQVSKKLETIDIDFLKWIDKEYPNSGHEKDGNGEDGIKQQAIPIVYCKIFIKKSMRV